MEIEQLGLQPGPLGEAGSLTSFATMQALMKPSLSFCIEYSGIVEEIDVAVYDIIWRCKCRVGWLHWFSLP